MSCQRILSGKNSVKHKFRDLENHNSKDYFEHKNKHTRITQDGKTLNQIDHVLIDKQRHTNITDDMNFRGTVGDTDN